MCQTYVSGAPLNKVKSSADDFSQAYEGFVGIIKKIGKVAMDGESAETFASMPSLAVDGVSSSIKRAGAIAGTCKEMSAPQGEQSPQGTPPIKKYRPNDYSLQTIKFDL